MKYVNAPVHDLLIRIKNAYMARKTTIEGVVFSTFKMKVLELLKEYNFVKDVQVVDLGNNKKLITIYLRAVKDPINDIPNIKFFSKPSRAWYVGYKDIYPVAGGRGIGIISTSEGLMAAHVAKQKKL